MQSYCRDCKHHTYHRIIKNVKKSYDNDDYSLNEIWQIIECKGSSCITFRRIVEDYEDRDFETGGPGISQTIYPQYGSESILKKGYLGVDFRIKRIYNEVISAFNAGLNILCAGGLRAIIEGICYVEGIFDGIVINTKGVPKRVATLQGKISGIAERGVLTSQHAEILHNFRFLGNDALHHLNAPSKEELKIAIEIIEHTLDNIYELPNKENELKSHKFFRKGV